MGSGNFTTDLPLMSSIGNGRKLAPLGVTGRWRSNRQGRSCHAAECGKLKMRSIDVDALPTAEELQAMFIEGAQAGIAELHQKSAGRMRSWSCAVSPTTSKDREAASAIP